MLAAGAVPPELPPALHWRGLLQEGGGGVKTAVIFNLNTKSSPVFCINVRGGARLRRPHPQLASTTAAMPVPTPMRRHLPQVTKPFSDASHTASGSQAPTGGDIDALAQQASWQCNRLAAALLLLGGVLYTRACCAAAERR